MILGRTESVFSSKSLKESMKTFFGNDERRLFASAIHGQPSATRVAVTSAKDLGRTACLIANYNHPLLYATNNVEEEYTKEMKIWEAGLAASAAPFYLPPFEKRETKTQYVDGAVYANCPAEVAFKEIENIWPDRGASLDLMVSLGTGIQKSKHTEAPALVNIGLSGSVGVIVPETIGFTQLVGWVRWGRCL